MNRVRVGAITVIVCTNRVRRVRNVVLAVEIFAIPARWEEYLSTHSIGTLMVKEIFSLSPVWIVIVSVLVV